MWAYHLHACQVIFDPFGEAIICLTILGLTFPMFVAKRYIKELKGSEALSLILRSLAFIVFIVEVAQDRA